MSSFGQQARTKKYSRHEPRSRTKKKRKRKVTPSTLQRLIADARLFLGNATKAPFLQLHA
jgi:hypothetical protein